jgi:hypothetical protein
MQHWRTWRRSGRLNRYLRAVSLWRSLGAGWNGYAKPYQRVEVAASICIAATITRVSTGWMLAGQHGLCLLASCEDCWHHAPDRRCRDIMTCIREHCVGGCGVTVATLTPNGI